MKMKSLPWSQFFERTLTEKLFRFLESHHNLLASGLLEQQFEPHNCALINARMLMAVQVQAGSSAVFFPQDVYNGLQAALALAAEYQAVEFGLVADELAELNSRFHQIG
jgi:hypothetical protein